MIGRGGQRTLTGGTSVTADQPESRLRAIARTAVRAAGGDTLGAVDRFMAGIEAELGAGANVDELFAEIQGVMKDAPTLVAGAEEALRLAGGHRGTAEAILRERLDARENPEFTGQTKTEMRRTLVPALFRILREEHEAYRRDRGA
jgi:hypothetical protein